MEATITTKTITLKADTCCTCGIAFGIPSDYMEQRRNDHAYFYCPNGHPQHYTGPSAAQKAQAEAEALRSQLALSKQTNKSLYQDLQAKEDEAERARRSAAAHKGAHTRTKRRIHNGVCPCCNRTFANLARHMAGQHPDYATEATA